MWEAYQLVNRPSPALLVLASLACSSPSPPTGASSEAGTDATADGSDGACFPFCGSASSSGGGTDGGDASCDQLKSQAEALQGAAQSCNRSLQNQCSGVAQGICCPITVTAGNDQAVSTFQQAVDLYNNQCDASCLTPNCSTAPSMDCQATPPSQGTCR